MRNEQSSLCRILLLVTTNVLLVIHEKHLKIEKKSVDEYDAAFRLFLKANLIRYLFQLIYENCIDDSKRSLLTVHAFEYFVEKDIFFTFSLSSPHL